MRFKEETINHPVTSFRVFHDICGWWYAEVKGQRLPLGFDFAWGFDPVKERQAAICVGRDYIDHVL
jgi:hypothetical protein